MRQRRYAEVLQVHPEVARSQERAAFLRLMHLLWKAQREGANSAAMVDCLSTMNRVWSWLLEDLSSPRNALAPDVKARLISIGIFMLKETELIRSGQKQCVKNLTEITGALVEGLE